ncbi:MAG: hypothetical protein MK135_10380, partial [Polyangiaceae bacterium]|nr:hypothetical protein [Polyangiaceae bacterium]
FAFLLLGCGRPATEEECREILRKSARFELEEQLGKDSTLIDAELKTIEEELNGSLLEQCVGKRIRESELACIRNAQTAKELFEDCQ